MWSSGYCSTSVSIDFSLKSKEKNSEADIQAFFLKNKKNLFQKKAIDNDNDVIEENIKNGNVVYIDLLNKNEDEDDDEYYDDDEDLYLNSKDNTLEEILEKLEEWDENEYEYSIYINETPSTSLFEYINLNLIDKYKIYNLNFQNLRSKIEIGNTSNSIYGRKTIEHTSINLTKYLDILSLPDTKLELISESEAY